MKFEGRAALAVWPVDVVIGNRVFRLDSQPAMFWILRILDMDMLGIISDGISSDILDDMLMDGDITFNDCVKAAQEAIAAASGMFWWSAVRLVTTANEQTGLYGELALSGIDPNVISLGRYVSAVYALCVRNADEKQRNKIDREIESTPVGMSASDRYDADKAADQFETLMRSRGR